MKQETVQPAAISHPAITDRYADTIGNTPEFMENKRAIKTGWESLQSLNKLIEQPNPSLPAGQRLETIQTRAKQIEQATGLGLERAVKNGKSLRDKVESEINESLDIKPRGTDSETRAALREMSETEREKAIANAIEAADSEILGAIIQGNMLTTGLDDANRDNVRTRFLMKKNPDLLQKQRDAAAASDKAESALMELYSTAKRAQDTETLARARAAQDKWAKIDQQIKDAGLTGWGQENG
ncbi:hypothetical protein [Hydrogenovibrio halophilus]|uniref:hypothetical protein n=1 Tax=Hydrogenovibrio halophilus TaxID=373391 RepID=UPI0012FDB2C5|nr:hypothetical protein [Hydrogenovibrio halophilus]